MTVEMRATFIDPKFGLTSEAWDIYEQYRQGELPQDENGPKPTESVDPKPDFPTTGKFIKLTGGHVTKRPHRHTADQVREAAERSREKSFHPTRRMHGSSAREIKIPVTSTWELKAPNITDY